MKHLLQLLGSMFLLGTLACAKTTPVNTSALPFFDDFEANALSADWQILNGEAFALQLEGGELGLTPNRNTVWYQKDQGPGVVRMVRGDFKLSTSTRARKRTNPSTGVDAGYQFSGIIVRDPASDSMLSGENYVFSVVGYRGDYLSAETKTTVDGHSTVLGPAWPSSDADLRICRVGSTFSLHDRPYSGSRTATGAWHLATRYDRPDLPEAVQAGLIAYAFTDAFDLHATFSHVAIEPITSLEDCTRD